MKSGHLLHTLIELQLRLVNYEPQTLLLVLVFSFIELSDLYTFDTNEETARETYNIVCEAYSRIFDRLGLKFHKGQ